MPFCYWACSDGGEAFAPIPDGSINAANRREMKKSDVTQTEQFHLRLVHNTPKEKATKTDHFAFVFDKKKKKKRGGKKNRAPK